MIDYKTRKAGQNNDILVMDVYGKLDTDTSVFLFDCVQGFLEEGMTKFVLDCSKLDYISSMGLGTLVRANGRLKKQGGAMAICGASGVVAEVFRLMRLDHVFSMYDSVDEAIGSLE